jgi:hypothetical protein
MLVIAGELELYLALQAFGFQKAYTHTVTHRTSNIKYDLIRLQCPLIMSFAVVNDRLGARVRALYRASPKQQSPLHNPRRDFLPHSPCLATNTITSNKQLSFI